MKISEENVLQFTRDWAEFPRMRASLVSDFYHNEWNFGAFRMTAKAYNRFTDDMGILEHAQSFYKIYNEV